MEFINRRTGKQGSICKYELFIEASEEAPIWQVGLLDVEELRKKAGVK